MINVDLSRALHPRFWDLLVALLPGMFFEISYFVGCPDSVQRLLLSLQLERYLEIMIALFLAFVIGNGLMFFAYVIQKVINRVYKMVHWLRAKCIDFAVATVFSSAIPPKTSKFASYIVNVYNTMHSNAALHGAQDAWHRAATTLLNRRYGITLSDEPKPEEWRAWSAVLGKFEPPKGHLLTTATHATGWSGIAAMYLAPRLRAEPYAAFSWFLVFCGIWGSWVMAKRWGTPLSAWLVGLRATLDEIPAVASDGSKTKGMVS